MYRGNKMISEINSFTAYLQEVKHTAKNTEVSYHRDLLQMAGFMEEMGILSYEDIDSEDFTTLGGLAMFLIGRIPKAGDTFTYKNLQFEVVDMDRGRVDKLLVIRKEEEEE